MKVTETIIHILCDFPFQLVLAANLFAWSFPKRSGFWLRELAVFVPLFVIYDIGTRSFGYHILTNRILDKSLMLIPVACICAGILFCRRCSFTEAVFCCASAHPAQNLVFSLTHILLLQTGIAEDSFSALLVSLTVLTLGYTAVYRLFAVRMAEIREYVLERKRLLINSVIVMLYVVYLYTMVSDENVTVLTIFVVADVLALIMQFSFFSESALEWKYRLAEELLRTEQKRQRQISENTETINRKCHDLKHQVSALRQMSDGPERQKYLQEIENAVLIYESTIKTGCETLDLLLMEKLLFCREHAIRLSCMADGTLISGMDTMDICSLFGNALDNAIESVLREPEESCRVISFRIAASGNFVIVHFENYVSHEVVLRNGLPLTSKTDKQYHGFGVLSIRRITEKYSGTVSIRIENSQFQLNLLFPRETVCCHPEEVPAVP